MGLFLHFDHKKEKRVTVIKDNALSWQTLAWSFLGFTASLAQSSLSAAVPLRRLES